MLPREGGLLEQDRAYLPMIHLFNQRYNYFTQLSPDEVVEWRMKYRDFIMPDELPNDLPPSTWDNLFK